MATGWRMTEDTDPPGGREAEPRRNQGELKCPRCGTQMHLSHQFLDSRKSRDVQLFECQCGERLWDD